MSIQTVSCPGCGQAVSVPSSMTNVRCPKCSTIWNVTNPAAAQIPAAVKQAQAETDSEKQTPGSLPEHLGLYVIAGGVSVVVLVLILIGLGTMLGQSVGGSDANGPDVETVAGGQGEAVETIKPRDPEPYREVKLPEAQRRRIYDDYRKVARTSVEQPLLLPQSGVRSSVEGTLQAIFDREIQRFAAAHDITQADVQEIIKEGDAKGWDPTPRSNARRDGKRVYSEEKSKGWKAKPLLP